METLGKWLIAGAILCVIGFFSLKDEKNAGKERIYLLVLCLILGIAGYNCLSNKNQTYPENNNVDRISPNNSHSHGENIPFKSKNYVYKYTSNAYFGNKDFACKVEVKSHKGILYAFPNGTYQAYTIYDAPYDAPGKYFTYWAGAPIYFN